MSNLASYFGNLYTNVLYSNTSFNTQKAQMSSKWNMNGLWEFINSSLNVKKQPNFWMTVFIIVDSYTVNPLFLSFGF